MITRQITIKIIYSIIVFSYYITICHGKYSYDEDFEVDPDKAWHVFKSEHRKTYRNQSEETYRYKIWIDNYNYVRNHNKKAISNEYSYKLGMNSFCDLSDKEISTHKFGLKLSSFHRKNIKDKFNNTETKQKLSSSHKEKSLWEKILSIFSPSSDKSSQDEDTFNWVDKGYVSPVKDQGLCGACWVSMNNYKLFDKMVDKLFISDKSFVSTSALESQVKMLKGKKVTFSEQNLIDCSVSYGNDGCDGGLMSDAFAYVRDNKGINSASVYPYTGPISKCKYNKSDPAAQVSGYKDLPTGEESLKEALKTAGPIGAGIDANHKSFVLYKGGIYYEPKCNPSDLNHAVLVVGYGSSDGKDYWIIKNSWGKKWGEDGYMRIARNKDNHCGIASLIGYPILA